MDWPISWNDVKNELEQRSGCYILNIADVPIYDAIMTLFMAGGGIKEVEVPPDFWTNIPVGVPIMATSARSNVSNAEYFQASYIGVNYGMVHTISMTMSGDFGLGSYSVVHVTIYGGSSNSATVTVVCDTKPIPGNG